MVGKLAVASWLSSLARLSSAAEVAGLLWGWRPCLSGPSRPRILGPIAGSRQGLRRYWRLGGELPAWPTAAPADSRLAAVALCKRPLHDPPGDSTHENASRVDPLAAGPNVGDLGCRAFFGGRGAGPWRGRPIEVHPARARQGRRAAGPANGHRSLPLGRAGRRRDKGRSDRRRPRRRQVVLRGAQQAFRGLRRRALRVGGARPARGFPRVPSPAATRWPCCKTA